MFKAGTGTGMGKIIQKQAKMERISQYAINEKSLFLTVLDILNGRKRRVGIAIGLETDCYVYPVESSACAMA